MIRGLVVALLVLPVFGDTDRDSREHKRILLIGSKNVRMEFVWIKPGKFKKGSPADEKDHRADETLHVVTLTKGFWMQTTPVTQAQWEAAMGSNPSGLKGDPNLPVEQVSWDDCQEFLKKLNEMCKNKLGKLRAGLPTEAEWEYACRAGSTERWSFGDDETKLGEYAWYDKNSDQKTHPVAQKKPNRWGLFDMHGNVWQWCEDWWEENLTDAVNPHGPETGLYRLMRGGSYTHVSGYTRSASRGYHGPESRYSYIGGRVALH